MVTMQAAEKLGIVYIGKAGGKVIPSTLIHFVILSWHLYPALILRNAIPVFARTSPALVRTLEEGWFSNTTCFK